MCCSCAVYDTFVVIYDDSVFVDVLSLKKINKTIGERCFVFFKERLHFQNYKTEIFI